MCDSIDSEKTKKKSIFVYPSLVVCMVVWIHAKFFFRLYFFFINATLKLLLIHRPDYLWQAQLALIILFCTQFHFFLLSSSLYSIQYMRQTKKKSKGQSRKIPFQQSLSSNPFLDVFLLIFGCSIVLCSSNFIVWEFTKMQTEEKKVHMKSKKKNILMRSRWWVWRWFWPVPSDEQTTTNRSYVGFSLVLDIELTHFELFLYFQAHATPLQCSQYVTYTPKHLDIRVFCSVFAFARNMS